MCDGKKIWANKYRKRHLNCHRSKTPHRICEYKSLNQGVIRLFQNDILKAVIRKKLQAFRKTPPSSRNRQFSQDASATGWRWLRPRSGTTDKCRAIEAVIVFVELSSLFAKIAIKRVHRRGHNKSPDARRTAGFTIVDYQPAARLIPNNNNLIFRKKKPVPEVQAYCPVKGALKRFIVAVSCDFCMILDLMSMRISIANLNG